MYQDKFYINGYFLIQKVNGVQRFAINLIQELDKILYQNSQPGIQFMCIVPKNIEHDFKIIKVVVVKSGIGFIDRKQTLWEQLVLPFASRNGLLLNLCNFAPIFKKKQLVVIHDAIPFKLLKSRSSLREFLFCFIISRVAKKVKYLASVSKFSANEILEVIKIKREIIVLGNSGEHIQKVKSNDGIIQKLGLQSKQYILSVSSQANVMHKNFNILCKVAKHIDLPLIAVAEGKSQEGLVFTGRVSDGELKALYSNATVFIFPSFYEGFGIPILESFHCGTPCVVSDIPIFHEICADAALYFDPANYIDLISKINMLINSETLAKDMVNKGYSRIREYQWSKITSKLLKIIT
ncbi:MAG: glycosyltransferase family 4 protein [Neisseriaceae bacterium]